MHRVRNTLLVIVGVCVVALAVRFIDRRMDEKVSTLPPGPDRVVDATLTTPPKIYRMEAPLEELRKIPALDGMERADEIATKMLPSGVETAGKLVQPDEVLEGYAHPNGRRFFIIMKPGTRAYSVFVEP